MAEHNRASALGDIRVLDLSTHVAGPYCTKLLAGFGADVIKVEPPTGDPARRIAPFFHDVPATEGSLLYLYLNTNKRSVTLDIAQVSGRDILRELVTWADVVVESFRPGTLDALGIGYKDLAALKPGIVMVSVTPFGQTGPYSGYKGSEIVESGLGGFMYTYGPYDRAPLMHGGHQVQYHCGANAATATMVALFHQRAMGEGQHVDVSHIETQAATNRDTTSLYGYMGAIRRRAPKEDPATADMGGIVPSRDGYFIGGEGGIPRSMQRGLDWEELVGFFGREDLRQFAGEEARQSRRKELLGIIREEYAKRSKYELVESAQQRHYMFGPVETPADVVHSPQMAARGFFTTAEHPTTGPVQFPGRPFVMSETPWQLRRRAPLLGEHNAEVYGGMLGRSAEELVLLREQRAI
ncbi:MAG: CoA transferase [Chloroflexi bacterium]|nr:CoA transferase [Chloroflexota bacterium]